MMKMSPSNRLKLYKILFSPWIPTSIYGWFFGFTDAIFMFWIGMSWAATVGFIIWETND